MRASASFGKHPIHPMLVAVPIGLLVSSFAFDLLHIWRGEAVWREVALYNLAAGLISALAAAIPGFIDYVSLSGGAALRLAHWHFAANMALVSVCGINLWLRFERGEAGDAGLLDAPFLLSALGMLLLAVSGWLGGEMVYAHGVAVDVEGAERDVARSNEQITG